jgi:hypothetical protein
MFCLLGWTHREYTQSYINLKVFGLTPIEEAAFVKLVAAHAILFAICNQVDLPFP